MTPRFDPDLALAVLDVEDRAAIGRFAEALGVEPDCWWMVPPLRILVETLAVLRLAADMDLPRDAALRAAAEQIGIDDGYGERETHPGDSIGRRIHRWLAAADAGQNVRDSNDRAA